MTTYVGVLHNYEIYSSYPVAFSDNDASVRKYMEDLIKNEESYGNDVDFELFSKNLFTPEEFELFKKVEGKYTSVTATILCDYYRDEDRDYGTDKVIGIAGLYQRGEPFTHTQDWTDIEFVR